MEISNCFTASLDDYEMERIISMESFETVHTAQEKSTGKDVRIHVIRFTSDQDVPCLDASRFDGKMMFLKNLDHPNVVKILALGKNGKDTFYVTPSMKGDMEELLTIGELPPTAISKCIYGIVKGMEYIHSMDIIHGDLKNSNVLVDDNFEPVISELDFSVSKTDTSTHVMVGTPLFMAPEMRLEDSGYTEKVDVFSFAMLLYMIYNRNPVDEMRMDDGSTVRTPFHLGQKILNGVRWPRPDGIPDFTWDLITECWSSSPDSRLSFTELAEILEKNVEMWAFEGTDIPELNNYISTFQNI